MNKIELQRSFFVLRIVVLFLFCFLFFFVVPDVLSETFVAVLLHSLVTVLVVRMRLYIISYNRWWTTGSFVLSECCYGIFLVCY